MFFKLALKSLRNRRGSVVLTLMAMTVSIFVLLAVEHIRYQARGELANTVSGVDLIVVPVPAASTCCSTRFFV